MKDHIPGRIMEENWATGKSKLVVKWLRFGCTFLEKARVGYDFAQNDGDLLRESMYDSHPPVSPHRHSVDSENR